MAQEFRFDFKADLSQFNQQMEAGERDVLSFESAIESAETELNKLTALSARVARSIQKLNRDFKNGAISVDTYNRNLKRYNTLQKQVITSQNGVRSNIRAYQQSLLQLRGGYQVASKTTAKALPVVQEFGRAIQDLPFGIIGVGNNLTQMGDAFGILARKVGGARAALAIFGRALLGPAGILVAFSALISTLTVYARRTKSSADSLSKVRQEVEKLTKSLSQDLRISKLKTEILEGHRQSYIEQLLANAGILTAQIGIVDELLEQEKANLKLAKAEAGRRTVTEKIAEDQVKATAALFAALLATGKIANQQFAIQFPNLSDFVNFFKDLDLSVQVTQDNVKATTSEIKEISEREQRIKDLNEIIAELKRDQNDELEKANRLIAQQTSLANASNLLAQLFDPRGTRAKAGLLEILGTFRNFADSLKNQSLDLADDIQSNLTKIPLGFAESLQGGLLGLADFLDKLQGVEFFLRQLSVNVINILVENLGPALSQFGETIGREIQRGADLTTAAGRAFGSAIAGMISKIADELIKLGILAVGIGKVQLTLDGLTSGGSKIVAGLAAIATGIALKGISAAAAGASGGTVTTSGSGFVPNQQFSGSMSGSASGGFGGGGEVVFRIAGTSLIGVIDRTLKGKNKTTADIIR